MRYEEIPLGIDYERAGIKKKETGYPRLYAYLLDPSEEMEAKKRPAAVICPGGGYKMTSERSGEPIAMACLSRGVQAFVLRYSVAPDRYPAAFLELSETVALLREHAEDWSIDPEKIMVWGFSAGGHLALSLGVYWQDELIKKVLNRRKEEVRPNALVLAYPVVSTGPYAHRDSFEKLLGNRENREELLEKLSLERHIGSQVPPVFLWATSTDEVVPVQNSLLLAAALKEAGVDLEFHLYRIGTHGLALANEETKMPNGYGVQKECQSWINLAHTWWNSLFLER